MYPLRKLAVTTAQNSSGQRREADLQSQLDEAAADPCEFQQDAEHYDFEVKTKATQELEESTAAHADAVHSLERMARVSLRRKGASGICWCRTHERDLFELREATAVR